MTENYSYFATVEEAVEEIRQGRMVVLVDDEDRENEGDLAMAAEKITPEAINFMAKNGRGLICMPLTEERCDELHLPLMSPINTSVHGTAFTEAIDARVGVTTGMGPNSDVSVRNRAMPVGVVSSRGGPALKIGIPFARMATAGPGAGRIP